MYYWDFKHSGTGVVGLVQGLLVEGLLFEFAIKSIECKLLCEGDHR